MTILAVPVGGVGELKAAPFVDIDTALEKAASRVCNSRRTATQYLAKFLVHCIRPMETAQMEYPLLSSTQAVEMFRDLLKHYYHNSTSGRCDPRPYVYLKKYILGVGPILVQIETRDSVQACIVSSVIEPRSFKKARV